MKSWQYTYVDAAKAMQQRQRPVLYLGEINSSQELAWRKSIEVFEDGKERPSALSLFPADRCEAVIGC